MNPYENVIGITGNIGCGKSTVCEMLESKGALVIRADELARRPFDSHYGNFPEIKKKILELVKEHTPTMEEAMLFPGGSLDRKLLGKIVFANKSLTEKLNSIIHPEVKILFSDLIHKNRNENKIILYDVPLLYETGLDKLVKKTVVVFCDPDLAVKRASQRLNLDEFEVKKRMNQQISIDKKRDMADYVLNNSGNFLDLQNEVEKLWNYLQELQ